MQAVGGRAVAGPGGDVVLHTHDLLRYSRYDKIPWADVYGKDTMVVIPHVVVDEIDKKSHAISDTIKRRARGDGHNHQIGRLLDLHEAHDDARSLGRQMPRRVGGSGHGAQVHHSGSQAVGGPLVAQAKGHHEL